MNRLGSSKVLTVGFAVVMILPVAYSSFMVWDAIREKIGAAKRTAVGAFVGSFEAQLKGDLRFEDVRVVGYRCDDGSHPYVGMSGTVASRTDWDALNSLGQIAKPPLPLSIRSVLIRPPVTNFVDYGATLTPEGRVIAGPGISRRPTVEMAMRYLSSVDLFAPGGWGLCRPQPTRDVVAVLFIASQTNAVELFSNIVTNGRAEAKIYALCGIRIVARDQFDAFARSAANSAGWKNLPFIEQLKRSEFTTIRTARGCVGYNDSPWRVIEAIRRGEYDDYFRIRPAN